MGMGKGWVKIRIDVVWEKDKDRPGTAALVTAANGRCAPRAAGRRGVAKKWEQKITKAQTYKHFKTFTDTMQNIYKMMDIA